MRNPDRETLFRFKQFDVLNNISAMKVGTDGVLLGAWAFADMPRDIVGRGLDVGTGTGVLALMLAQRFSNLILDAVEISEEAVSEADFNFRESKWGRRLSVTTCDFNDYVKKDYGAGYDLIISNPPFFDNGAESPEDKRRIARHEGTLNFQSLFKGAGKLLNESGRIALVAPFDSRRQIVFDAELAGFSLVRYCEVKTVGRKPPKRFMGEFMKKPKGERLECVCQELTIHDSAGGYTDDYIQLTRDFYLNF